MRIELKFTDSHARSIRYYLGKRYNARKTTGLKALCKSAILNEVAAGAKEELERLARENSK